MKVVIVSKYRGLNYDHKQIVKIFLDKNKAEEYINNKLGQYDIEEREVIE